jgi:hypothetical protein
MTQHDPIYCMKSWVIAFFKCDCSEYSNADERPRLMKKSFRNSVVLAVLIGTVIVFIATKKLPQSPLSAAEDALPVPPPIDPDKLPSVISHRDLGGGVSEYVISAVNFKQDERWDKTGVEDLKKFTPNADEISADVAGKTLTIRGKLAIADLRKGIDVQARYGTNFMPHWEELLIRDQRSKKFDAKKLKLLAKVDFSFPKEAPDDHDSLGFLKRLPSDPGSVVMRMFSCEVSKNDDTFTMDFKLSQKDGAFAFNPITEKKWIKWDDFETETEVERENWNSTRQVRVRSDEQQQLVARLNQLSSYCKCHSRYSLRVFDEQNQFVWEDTENVYGYVIPMSADINQDGADEIIVFSEDHGKTRLLIFGK